MPKIQRKNVIIALKLLVFCALLIVLAVLFGTKDNPRTNDAPQYQTSSLTLDVFSPVAQKITASKEYIGFVMPVHSVGVRPFISGFIEDVRVSGGQNVQKGDILVVLRQAEYIARKNAAKAAVEQAQASFKNADSYYRRLTNAGSQAIAAADKDKAYAAFLTAKAALSQAKADYDLAVVNYDYTVIKAPVSGVVGNVSLTKGQYVSPAAQLFQIVQTNPIRVVFSITDKEYIDFLQSAAPLSDSVLKIRLSNGTSYPYTGKLRFTDNALDKKTNTLAVYADFENPDGLLISNAYVTVFLERFYDNAVFINSESVSLSPEGVSVQVVNNGKVSQKTVDVIAEKENGYVVKNTFNINDFIVLTPLLRQPSEKVSLNVISRKS